MEADQRTRACAICAADISHRSTRAITCSRKCQDRRAYLKKHPLREMRCRWCDEVMEVIRSSKKHCSTRCRSAAQYHRDIEASRAYVRERARGRDAVEKAAYIRAYREANREKLCKQSRERYASNRELDNERSRRWRQNNPELVNLYGHVRRARKADNGVFLVRARDWRRMVDRYRGCCAYCGVKPDGGLHREHVIPVVRGGRHSIGNLLPACLPCNYAKGTRLLTEWRFRVPAVEVTLR